MAGRSFLTAALFLLLAGRGLAAWTISSSETEAGPAPSVERRHLVVSDRASGEDATIELALFSPRSVAIRVVDNPGGDELSSVVKRMRAFAGVNGGYFDPQNAPVGLVISDGKMIASFRKAKLLSGLLVVTKGRAELMRSGDYSPRKNVTAALQCGPFLVDGGKAVAGLNGTRPARRTFVLTTGTDRAAIGYCSTVTLAQLGDILAIPELKTQRALNLDGGSSSGFWFNGKEGATSVAEQKSVRNFVV
ncbi:MAG TPA: phosphodiester glycosidase family protein, partial [Chthoniobacterales bacterium]